jgi:hypothetical protein
MEKALIMSPCTVTADYLALGLFDLNLADVPHIQEAVNRGLNMYDIAKLDVKRISLS